MAQCAHYSSIYPLDYFVDCALVMLVRADVPASHGLLSNDSYLRQPLGGCKGEIPRLE